MISSVCLRPLLAANTLTRTIFLVTRRRADHFAIRRFQVPDAANAYTGQVAGIFTERDYARKVGPNRRKPEETRIEEVMTKELIPVDLNQTVNECMVLMTNNHIRHLLVMDEGQLVGMISVGDVVKDIIEELEFHVEQLTSYITGLR